MIKILQKNHTQPTLYNKQAVSFLQIFAQIRPLDRLFRLEFVDQFH